MKNVHGLFMAYLRPMKIVNAMGFNYFSWVKKEKT